MRPFLTFLLAAFLLACQPETDRNLSRAFYHWQTKVDLSQTEKTWVDSLGTRKMYIRFFDVDWDGETKQPIPLATVQIDPEFSFPEIIPTVYITNRSLKAIREEQIPELAKRITDGIQTILRRYPQLDASEIQIDCDWSGQTRENTSGYWRRSGRKQGLPRC